MSNPPEMDNTGRGRVHREPRFLPGQARPHRNDDGLPTYEQQEGYLPSYEEVTTGRSVPQQASESPDRQLHEKRKRILTWSIRAIVHLGYVVLTLLVLWIFYGTIKNGFTNHDLVDFFCVGLLAIICLMALGVNIYHEHFQRTTD